jgi:hypothetical protein
MEAQQVMVDATDASQPCESAQLDVTSAQLSSVGPAPLATIAPLTAVTRWQVSTLREENSA